MADDKRIDGPTGTSFVGHEWDGIEELDTPMPRWWLYTLYATIVFAIVMVVLYPAIPMLHGATPGTLGWSSRGQLDRELSAERSLRAPLMHATIRYRLYAPLGLRTVDIAEITAFVNITFMIGLTIMFPVIALLHASALAGIGLPEATS